MTAVPAVPNSLDQLYKITVKPGEVKNRLPGAAAAGLGNAQGPVKKVRVSPGLVTALVRWLDSRSKDIDAIFGVNDETPNFKDLVVNDFNIPSNKITGRGIVPSLQEVAKSVAAAIYAVDKDRLQGQKTTLMNGNVTPDGNLSEVFHEVQTNGVLTTSMVLPEKVQPYSIWSFMDAGTRMILQREIQSDKGGG